MRLALCTGGFGDAGAASPRSLDICASLQAAPLLLPPTHVASEAQALLPFLASLKGLFPRRYIYIHRRRSGNGADAVFCGASPPPGTSSRSASTPEVGTHHFGSAALAATDRDNVGEAAIAHA